MNSLARCLFLSLLAASVTIAIEAKAQPFQNNAPRPGDRAGNFRGNQSRNARPDARYVLPFDGSQQYAGSYFVRENRYYYVPRGDRRQANPQVYQGGQFSHVEDLAMRLETLANDLCLDLHHNYSHNRGFRETYREAYQILQTAQAIHDANHHNDHQAIQRRVRGMDEKFHHIQQDVHRWTRHEHQPVGHTDMHTKLELMESTIHHLMYDVGVQHGHDHGHDHDDRPRGNGGFGQAPRPR